MKSSILWLLVFVLKFSFISGQISLESTYDGMVERVNLQFSGEKYYYLDYESKQVKLFNSDHSPWKTIDLPCPEGAVIWFIDHLSEAKINSDSKLEIIYSFYIENGDDATYEERIVNDEGTILLSIPNGYFVEFSEMPGLENKLVTYIKGTPTPYSEIYTVPALTLEHSYELEVGRWNLENSGEKYVELDLSNKLFNIYNADHSPWKTIPVPDPTGLTQIYQWNISETKIINDNQLEIIYAYYSTIPSGKRYVRVINEAGTPLFTIPDAQQFNFEDIPGLPNKIIAYFLVDSHHISRVYDVPGFVGEMYYEYYTHRVDLEISGETYYYVDEATREIKLFDGDHNLWKTIIPSVPSNAGMGLIQHLSEHTIIKDDKIEIVFSFHVTENEITQYESRVINEDGTDLLVLPNATYAKLRDLPGADPKLVAYYLQEDNSYITEVYGLPTSPTLTEEVPSGESVISVFPNPATDILEIELTNSQIKFVRIFSLSGQLLQKFEPESAKTVLDLSVLKAGSYILEVQDEAGNTFKEKVIVR